MILTTRLPLKSQLNIAVHIFNNRNNVKRTMFTTRSVFPLIRPNAAIGSIRHYPNQFSIGHFNYNARMGNGKKLPPHEYSHQVIQRNSDGKVLGALTTDPKPTFESTLIDSQEYFNGKPVQPGENGQYATAFNQPKIIETPTNNVIKPVFKPDPKLQQYADKHEETLNKFYKNKGADYCEVRRHKDDDSHLYNENGTRDYENFP
jgi:hypothetical protein